jgi:hypothetical protein
MRRTLLVLSGVAAATALSAAPAHAGPSSAPRYASAYTNWVTSASAVPIATTHSETASRTGAITAHATAAANRPAGWSAISEGSVVQSFPVAATPNGYDVVIDFTGVQAFATGGVPAGSLGTAAPADTVAYVGGFARLSGECTSAAPCSPTHTVVTGTQAAVSVSFCHPAVAAKTSLIVTATGGAWIRTPTTDDGSADQSDLTASVARMTVTQRSTPCS